MRAMAAGGSYSASSSECLQQTVSMLESAGGGSTLQLGVLAVLREGAHYLEAGVHVFDCRSMLWRE